MHSVRVRKSRGGGWAVLYDRQKGPAGYTRENFPFTDATRWLVLWRPARDMGKKFWACASEDRARAAMHKVQHDEDACGFWGAKVTSLTRVREDSPKRPEIRAKPPEIPVSPPIQPSRVRAREETPVSTEHAPPIKRPVIAAEEMPLNQRVKELMRNEVPEAVVVAALREGMSAMKTFFQDGEAIEVEDHVTREKFVKLWLEYQMGKAALEERARQKKTLDESHLEALLMQSPAARAEMRALLNEIEQTLAKNT